LGPWRDHWWNGHHCRFINGSWVIFDFGFYPWWPYWYPYDYYPYDYYPYSYSYDPGYYDSGVDQGEEYYDQNGYDSSDQNTDSTTAAAQEQLGETRLLPGRNRQRPRPGNASRDRAVSKQSWPARDWQSDDRYAASFGVATSASN